MPTEGSPPRVSPNKARSSKNVCQLGHAAVAKAIIVEDSNDKVITFLRPWASETGPANNMLSANAALGSDKDRALSAALTWNCRLNSGINGCTQYSNPKVATPAANMAKLVRRKAGVP